MLRWCAAAHASVCAMASLRRLMPAVLLSESASTSRSIRGTWYVVISCSKTRAIEETLVQLSASSVPVVSAL